MSLQTATKMRKRRWDICDRDRRYSEAAATACSCQTFQLLAEQVDSPTRPYQQLAGDAADDLPIPKYFYYGRVLYWFINQ